MSSSTVPSLPKIVLERLSTSDDQAAIRHHERPLSGARSDFGFWSATARLRPRLTGHSPFNASSQGRIALLITERQLPRGGWFR